MTQDFAKIRPEPILERKPVESPPAWSLMLTGGVVGVTIGVFASFLFYLSGHVPPLNGMAATPAIVASNEVPTDNSDSPVPAAEEGVKFEFYSALPDYEVTVDATPVKVRDPDAPLTMSVVLQSGAFQQQELANTEMRRQAALGLDVRVKQESTLPGRSLFLVQSGPYTTQRALATAEQILSKNNIQSLRTTRQ